MRYCIYYTHIQYKKEKNTKKKKKYDFTSFSLFLKIINNSIFLLKFEILPENKQWFWNINTYQNINLFSIVKLN